MEKGERCFSTALPVTIYKSMNNNIFMLFISLCIFISLVTDLYFDCFLAVSVLHTDASIHIKLLHFIQKLSFICWI